MNNGEVIIIVDKLRSLQKQQPIQINHNISKQMNTIRRGVTPVNPPKVDQVNRQPPRRIFGKDLKNIITTYHNKLAQSSSTSNHKLLMGEYRDKEKNQKVGQRNNSQKIFKKDPFKNQLIKQPLQIQQKKSIGQSTEASPKSMSIKDYLISKAPKVASQISPELSINSQMRQLVITWIIQLAHKMPLKTQTLFHCVSLFDFIISSYKNSKKLTEIVVCIENLQLLGLTCLFISAKYEEIYPPPVDLMVKVSDYTYSKKKIIQMEANILLEHQFNLTFPTRFTFLEQEISQQNEVQPFKLKRLSHMSTLLQQISLLQLWDDATEKQLAEASMFLGKKILRIETEIPNRKICQLSWKLLGSWRQRKNSVVNYLFDSDKYSFVGGIYLEQN